MYTLMSLFLASPASADPLACEDCSFLDVVSKETRLTSKGPSESSLPYLRAEEGGYTIDPDYFEQYQRVSVHEPDAFSDGGDEHYDRDEQPWWLVLLRIILAAAEYVEDLGLNGGYDGYLTVDGERVPAFVELDHFGSEVHGYVMVGAPFVLDGGICGSYEIPAGATLQINGTEGAPAGVAVHTATGSTTRRVKETFLFDVYATTSFDLALMNDRETLTGSIHLVITDPCADPAPITGRFVRRPVF